MIIEKLTNDFETKTEGVKKEVNYVLRQFGKEFTLSSNSEGFCEVYDLSGRIIKRLNSNDRFNLYSGVFLLRITIGKQTYYDKVIVRI